jgi:hypothetical protein
MTRIWKPNRRYVLNTTIPVSVKQWVWTPRKGLWVEYLNGLRCKSDYKLPEFLRALREGREHASEMI